MKLDIQSILIVIRRRKNSLKNTESSHLNLQTTCFQATHLMNAHLEGADLSNASLKEAKNLIINQLYDVKTLYKAELDESLRCF
jgi:uncharacterized protein YjbI with pentapeptide repeats